MNFFKIILLLFVIWGIGFIVFIQRVDKSERVISEKADAIIVLTGAQGRIDAGLRLLQEGKAERLFISGVGEKVALKDLSEYLVLFPKREVKSLENKVTLGHVAHSTEENAIESLAWIKKNNYNKIILVTSNYHMPRSLYLFKSLMPDISITSYSIVKKKAYYDKFKLAFVEYNKFLVAIIK